MPSIFLSASIPLPQRDGRFIETMDVIAIRDSIRALITVLNAETRIVFGGHPAITPLIRKQMRDRKRRVRASFRIYQSALFHKDFPPELADFEHIVMVPAVAQDRGASLHAMREQMIGSEKFAAAVFIGGMEGLFEEFEMFRAKRPDALVLPIASTGAAAKLLFEDLDGPLQDLLQDRRYLSLFRRILPKETISTTRRF
jgi:hypothetical protein